jgi:hypothetical protein
MGLWNKKISDLTVGNVVGFLLVIDFFSTLFNFTRSPRDEGTHPLQKLHQELDDDERSWVLSLRQEKWLGMTPTGGWDQYRNYEKYLRDVIVKRKVPEAWPDWMKAPSREPQDWLGKRI